MSQSIGVALSVLERTENMNLLLSIVLSGILTSAEPKLRQNLSIPTPSAKMEIHLSTATVQVGGKIEVKVLVTNLTQEKFYLPAKIETFQCVVYNYNCNYALEVKGPNENAFAEAPRLFPHMDGFSRDRTEDELLRSGWMVAISPGSTYVAKTVLYVDDILKTTAGSRSRVIGSYLVRLRFDPPRRRDTPGFKTKILNETFFSNAVPVTIVHSF